jgi:hypothetical protein
MAAVTLFVTLTVQPREEGYVGTSTTRSRSGRTERIRR